MLHVEQDRVYWVMWTTMEEGMDVVTEEQVRYVMDVMDMLETSLVDRVSVH